MTIIDDALRNIFTVHNDIAGNVITFRGAVVKGDFRRGWVTIEDVQTYTTLFECMAADVPGVAIRNRAAGPTENDTLTVNGIDYAITVIQPDGYGSVILILSRD